MPEFLSRHPGGPRGTGGATSAPKMFSAARTIVHFRAAHVVSNVSGKDTARVSRSTRRFRQLALRERPVTVLARLNRIRNCNIIARFFGVSEYRLRSQPTIFRGIQWLWRREKRPPIRPCAMIVIFGELRWIESLNHRIIESLKPGATLDEMINPQMIQ